MDKCVCVCVYIYIYIYIFPPFLCLSSQNKTKKHTKLRENKIIKKGFYKNQEHPTNSNPIKTLQTKKPNIKTHFLKSTVKEAHHQNPTTKKLIV